MKNRSLASLGLGATFATILAGGAVAQSDIASESNALDGLYGCADTIDDSARLACFDAAISSLRSAQSSGELIAITRDDVEAVEKDSFGFSLPSLPRLRGLFGFGGGSSDDAASNSAEAKPLQDQNRVEYTIKRTERFGNNRIRFYFENGHVWEQSETEYVRIPKVKNGVPNTAVIKKASFGSFLLRVNGKGVSVRVKRRD